MKDYTMTFENFPIIKYGSIAEQMIRRIREVQPHELYAVIKTLEQCGIKVEIEAEKKNIRMYVEEGTVCNFI